MYTCICDRDRLGRDREDKEMKWRQRTEIIQRTYNKRDRKRKGNWEGCWSFTETEFRGDRDSLSHFMINTGLNEIFMKGN